MKAIINGELNPVKKSCFDCDFCESACSWWCINQEAVKYRGSSIPGVINCHFWKPCKTVSQLQKEHENKRSGKNWFLRIFTRKKFSYDKNKYLIVAPK